MSARDLPPEVPDPTRAVPARPVPEPHGAAPTEAELLAATAARPWRALMDALACGLVVQDAGGAIVDCNPTAERLLGLRRDQLLGLAPLDARWRALDGDGHALPVQAPAALLAQRRVDAVDGVERGVCLPSGERRWIVVGTRPLAVEGAGWMVSTVEANTARRQLARGPSEQWQRLSATLEGAGVATWEWHVASGACSPMNAGRRSPAGSSPTWRR